MSNCFSAARRSIRAQSANQGGRPLPTITRIPSAAPYRAPSDRDAKGGKRKGALMRMRHSSEDEDDDDADASEADL